MVQSSSLCKHIFFELQISLLTSLPSLCCYPGVLFRTENHAPCSTLSATYQWAFAYWIFTIVNLSISMLTTPLCLIMADRNKGREHIWRYLMTFIKITLLIGTFIVYFGICYAYGLAENCGHLSKIVLAFIIIFPFAFCLILAMRGYLAWRKKNLKKESEQIEKEGPLIANEQHSESQET